MTNHVALKGTRGRYVIVWRNSQPGSDLMQIEWKGMPGDGVGRPDMTGFHAGTVAVLAGLTIPTAPRAVVYGTDTAGVAALVPEAHFATVFGNVDGRLQVVLDAI